MKLSELKDKILNKSVGNELLVLCCSDNYFIANQYVNEIVSYKNLNIIECDRLKSPLNSFFDNILYLIRVDTFNSLEREFSKYNNNIVVCNKVEDNLKDYLKDYIVEIPKLTDWQVKDYMKVCCPGLSDNSIDFIYSNSNGDIFKIDNEIDKLKIFNKHDQELMFKDIDNELGYCDMNTMSLFDFTNAIIRKDTSFIKDNLDKLNSLGVEPYQIVGLLLNNFRNIIKVNLSVYSNPMSLNMNPKLYNAIKFNYKNCSEKYIINCFEFLTEFDYKVKSGKYDISNNSLTNYLILKLLSIK